MAFDISAAFGDLRPTGPIRKMITEIELHLIDKNPANFYSMEGIDGLADNIRMFGLMEPLIVKATEDGRYMLISGHRRRAALCRLADEGFFPEGMHHKVDCILHEGPVNLPGIESLEKTEAAVKIMEQLKVLYANADTRVLSSADTAMQVRRTRELLTALKDLGYKLPGRMRDLVADAAKVSASRVARLDVIEKNLTDPRLRAAWKAGDLQETNAYEVARYAPEVQRHMTDMHVQHVCRSTGEQVQAFMQVVAADYEKSTPLPEEADAETGTPENVSTVDTKSGEEPQFDGKGGIVWDGAAAYLEQRHKEDDTFFELLCKKKEMFLRELGAVNTRQEGIERLKTIFRTRGGYSDGVDFSGSGKGLQLRKRICDKPIARTWTEVYDMLCTIALNEEAIRQDETDSVPENVSTVDTISAADTTSAAPAWNRAPEPPTEGRYLCLVDMNTTALHEQRCVWRDGKWSAYGMPLNDLFTVVAWWPLPKEEPRPLWWRQPMDEEEE